MKNKIIKYSEFLERKNPLRVKLINLVDQAQAVARKIGDNKLIIEIFGYDSKNNPVEIEAPFTFESIESRDWAFDDDKIIKNFASSVFMVQMANIDPDLNTDNFKQSKTEN